MDLQEYLESTDPLGFEPGVSYFAEGDFLEFYLSEDRAYARRIDHQLTVYRSVKDESFVGFKLKGVSKLKSHLPLVKSYEDRTVKLNIFLILAAGYSDAPPIARRAYLEACELAKDAEVNEDELVCV